jgi:cation transporter-like permease
MPGFTWPPRDTDRNRFLYRLQVVVYALVTAYFFVFALASGALVPWAICTVALAATVVVAVGLLLMRAQRRAAPEPDTEAAAAPQAAGQDPAPGR